MALGAMDAKSTKLLQLFQTQALQRHFEIKQVVMVRGIQKNTRVDLRGK
jgi:hypothetical protein